MARIEKNDGSYIIQSYFRHGKIIEIDDSNSTAKVQLQPEKEGEDGLILENVPIFFHCDDNVQELPNGALEGAAAAFDIGDQVAIVLDSNSQTAKIVANLTQKRGCGGDYLIVGTQHYWYKMQVVIDRDNFHINIVEYAERDNAIYHPLTEQYQLDDGGNFIVIIRQIHHDLAFFLYDGNTGERIYYTETQYKSVWYAFASRDLFYICFNIDTYCRIGKGFKGQDGKWTITWKTIHINANCVIDTEGAIYWISGSGYYKITYDGEQTFICLCEGASQYYKFAALPYSHAPVLVSIYAQEAENEENQKDIFEDEYNITIPSLDDPYHQYIRFHEFAPLQLVFLYNLANDFTEESSCWESDCDLAGNPCPLTGNKVWTASTETNIFAVGTPIEYGSWSSIETISWDFCDFAEVDSDLAGWCSFCLYWGDCDYDDVEEYCPPLYEKSSNQEGSFPHPYYWAAGRNFKKDKWFFASGFHEMGEYGPVIIRNYFKFYLIEIDIDGDGKVKKFFDITDTILSLVQQTTPGETIYNEGGYFTKYFIAYWGKLFLTS